MAFESINVASLKNALTSCKSAINYSDSTELINDITNDSIWSTGARDKLREALTTLTGVRYKELVNKLDTYTEVASLIERYKNLEEDNRNMRNQIESLRSRLYYTEYYTDTYTDSKGKTYSESRSRECKDYGVESQMHSLSNSIASNEREMETLKNKVAQAI